MSSPRHVRTKSRQPKNLPWFAIWFKTHMSAQKSKTWKRSWKTSLHWSTRHTLCNPHLHVKVSVYWYEALLTSSIHLFKFLPVFWICSCPCFILQRNISKAKVSVLTTDNKSKLMWTWRAKLMLFKQKFNVCFLVHFFKGWPRARCTRWSLGQETFQFIVIWETSDAEVEDGPLLWKLMAQR